MIFQVTPRRHRGKALSQHDVQTAEPVYGDMVVVQAKSDEFNRYSSIARFQRSGANDVQPLPELHDATLSWMGPNGFVLTGFEVIDGVTYAQSWWCRSKSVDVTPSLG
jgi:hypothetical protein